MRVTVFVNDEHGVSTRVTDAPTLEPLLAWEGLPLSGVQLHTIEERGDIQLQLVEIAAGGNFVMHSSPKLAFCHIVRGAGQLGMPGGRSLAYRGPETYVFHPDTLHDWHDVTEATLLAVAIMPDGERHP
jgi:hypothetical protein